MSQYPIHRRRLPDGRWQRIVKGNPVGEPEFNAELDAVAADALEKSKKLKKETPVYKPVERWEDDEDDEQVNSIASSGRRPPVFEAKKP